MTFPTRAFSAHAGAGPRQTYLDLSDVVSHAIWDRSCGGIPRVQLEVAAALARSDPKAVLFSLYDGVWRDLRPLVEAAEGDSDRVFADVKQFLPFPGATPSLRRPLETARLAKARLSSLRDRLFSRKLRFNPGDTLYVGGAFWTSRTTIKLCEAAAAEGAKLIVFVHDLMPIAKPQFTGHDFAAEYRQILRLPAHFIVSTRFNLDALATARKEMGFAEPLLISIIPYADEFPRATRNEREFAPPREVGRLVGLPFVLCVGTVEIRKNHAMLLSVWEELETELGDRLPRLVVAGRRGWKAHGALRRLDEFARSDGRVIFAEAPSDDALRWLYSACLFTVFPSLFEGWGLPVGESLWFGKPCAASDASSIPVAGRDLCVYFSPDDREQMKAAIRRLLDPDVRQTYETRIRSARLRTWAEVGHDIEGIITRQSSARAAPGDLAVSTLGTR